MRISSVETVVAPFSTGTWLDQQRVASPMSVFERFAANRASWRGPGADLVSVLIRSSEGASYGIGQTRGGAVIDAIVRDHLAPMLIGSDPLDIVTRTEELKRATAPYARGGVSSMAVSAVELALWDLGARAAGVPLCTMLGGSSDSALPTYVTCRSPQQLTTIAAADLSRLHAVKVGMPYGPPDGPDGLAGNLKLLREFREVLPDAVPLAVDCFMGWTESYTAQFASSTNGLNVAWIEEPLPPEDIDGYRRLRAVVSPIQLAAGEHLFGIAEALRYLELGCVDILQPDVTWCGGIRVAATLAAVAAERGVVFAPHAGGNQPWATHLLTAAGPAILAEVLLGLENPPTVPARLKPGIGVGLRPEQGGFPA